jgi:hypothetical protein
MCLEHADERAPLPAWTADTLAVLCRFLQQGGPARETTAYRTHVFANTLRHALRPLACPPLKQVLAEACLAATARLVQSGQADVAPGPRQFLEAVALATETPQGGALGELLALSLVRVLVGADARQTALLAWGASLLQSLLFAHRELPRVLMGPGEAADGRGCPGAHGSRGDGSAEAAGWEEAWRSLEPLRTELWPALEAQLATLPAEQGTLRDRLTALQGTLGAEGAEGCPTPARLASLEALAVVDYYVNGASGVPAVLRNRLRRRLRLAPGRAARGGDGDGSYSEAELSCLAARAFTAEMDDQIRRWEASAPGCLTLPAPLLAESMYPPVRHAEPPAVFDLQHTVTWRVEGEGMRAELVGSTRDNVWIPATEALGEGVWAWSVRCEAKGDPDRYVGVGVGVVEARALWPQKSTRLLSEGSLKEGTRLLPATLGFGPSDVVTVLVECEAHVVYFFVNGCPAGQVNIPGVLPGEHLVPMVYCFCRGDAFSYLPSLQVEDPASTRAGVGRDETLGGDSSPVYLYRNCSGTDVCVRGQPGAEGTVLRTIAPGEGVWATQLQRRGNSAWLRLAHQEDEAYCCQRTGDAVFFSVQLPPRPEDLAVVNPPRGLPEEPVVGDEADEDAHSPTPKVERIEMICASPAPAHRIRAGPTFDALRIGELHSGDVIGVTGDHTAEDGSVWVLLSRDSQQM